MNPKKKVHNHYDFTIPWGGEEDTTMGTRYFVRRAESVLSRIILRTRGLRKQTRHGGGVVSLQCYTWFSFYRDIV
jgi:hypothetical protein